MKNACLLIFSLLTSGQIAAQVAAAPQAIQPALRVLSESTVQQRDGSTITFQQVVPPVVTPQVQPAAAVAAPALTASDAATLSQLPVKDTQMLSISASVKANGFTVLRWTCGTSQRMQAVSNVDFRYLEGVGSLETEQASYFLILSAGPVDQPMTEAEAQAAQSLPVNGSAAFALAGGSTPTGAADAAALDAMEALLGYFNSNKAKLTALKAQRDADRAARELAARTAPPPPPRRSVIQFWPLQPAQRAAILENTQRAKGANQP